jgi:glycosyltransferase involved in cell wall biosynthesis
MPRPGGGFRLAFFGRLERRKGVYVLADALREVLPARPDLSVDWIGPDTRIDGGSVGRDLRSLLSPWSERIRFLGFLEGAEKFAALRRSDAVVMPSLWENAPYACLEAIACGKPVIATMGSGFDEILTDGVNALLVPPSEPSALAEAIGRLASGALPRQVGLDPEKTGRVSDSTILPELEQLYLRMRDSWCPTSAS